MSKNDQLSKSYSGVFGHQVMVKNRRNQAVITIPKVRTKQVPTDKQVAVRERIKLAAKYATNALTDPALLAEYSAKARKGMGPYRLAVNDFLRLPYIHKVDTSGYHGNPGDKITVVAGDDFKLTSVSVRITDPDCIVIEEDDCLFMMPSGNYEYTATNQIPSIPGATVLVRATDLPGNVTERSVTL